MGRLLHWLFLGLSLFCFNLFASPTLADFQTSELQVFSPKEFFRSFESSYFPELQHFSPEEFEDFRGVVEFLEREGIPIIIGANSNLQSIFELYLPMISRADYLRGPIVGVDSESSVGNVYFITHDAVHHFVGIPGLRRKDLEDPQAARDQLIRVLLLKEQVATSFSMFDHIRRYWNWRDEMRYGHTRENFQTLNRGIFSFGEMDRETAVDFIGDMVFGRPVEYAKKIFLHYEPKTAKAARNAGVPLPSFNFSRSMGSTLEAHLFRFIVPPLASLAGYYGEVGYHGFKKYSEAMADFMLQDWYVNWSDDFKIGFELNELEQRALLSLDRLKDSLPLTDGRKSHDGEFAYSRLRNEIAFFGRRVAEIKEMARLGKSSAEFSKQDSADLDQLYSLTFELHREMRDIENPISYESAKTQYDQLTEAAETNFPVSEYIPIQSRLPFIDYRSYWTDMTALALPRYGHNSNGFSPGAVQKLMIQKRRAERNLMARLYQKTQKFFLDQVRGVPTYTKTLELLERDYQESQSEQPVVRLLSNQSSYLNRLQDLKSILQFQLAEVILPQVLQFPSPTEERNKWIKKIQNLFTEIQSSIVQLERLYHQTFIDKEDRARSSLFRDQEIRTNIYFDEAFGVLWDLIRGLQEGKIPKDKLLRELDQITKAIQEGRYYEGSRTNLRLIGQISPVKSQRHFFVIPFLKRWLPLPNKKAFFEEIFNLPGRLFHRQKNQTEARISQNDIDLVNQGNGVYIVAINQETGIYDAIAAKNLLAKIGVQDIVVLASQTASPDLKKNGFKDPSLVISESEKPLEQLHDRVQTLLKRLKKVGVIICPEGNLPSPAVSMPLAAKPGAFVFARLLSHKLQLETPVFLIQALLNGLEAHTPLDPAPLTLRIVGFDQVPRDANTKDDPWVEETRLHFETRLNSLRLQRFIDLIDPLKSKNSSLYATSSFLQSYLPLSSWFGSAALKRCGEKLEALSAKPTSNEF